MSNKIVVTPAVGSTPAAAVVTDATISDIFTTAISSDSAVTGTYGLVQKALFFVGGMAVQNKRRMGSYNPL